MMLRLLKGASRLLTGPVKIPETLQNVKQFKQFSHFRKINSLNKINRFNKFYSKAAMTEVLFRQLIDYDTFTYTYIVGDKASREAVIIDPVIGMVDRDVKLIKELDLKLKYALNTHMHADHITGSGKLREKFEGCLSVIGKAAGAKADLHVGDRDVLKVGDLNIECLTTPGHTFGCMTFFLKEMGWFFTGDVLFVRGCGRTDFQQGSAETLYKSVHEKIFTHPDHCIVYPGHDYNGHTSTTVGEEKKYNPRLSKTMEEFIQIMDNLNLQKPKYIDIALPANEKDGLV